MYAPTASSHTVAHTHTHTHRPGHLEGGLDPAPWKCTVVTHTTKRTPRAGKSYPLEMHIVNLVSNETVPGCPEGGCIAVVGILFEVAEDGETAASITELEKIFGRLATVQHEQVRVRAGPRASCHVLLTHAEVQLGPPYCDHLEFGEAAAC